MGQEQKDGLNRTLNPQVLGYNTRLEMSNSSTPRASPSRPQRGLPDASTNSLVGIAYRLYPWREAWSDGANHLPRLVGPEPQRLDDACERATAVANSRRVRHSLVTLAHIAVTAGYNRRHRNRDAPLPRAGMNVARYGSLVVPWQWTPPGSARREWLCPPDSVGGRARPGVLARLGASRRTTERESLAVQGPCR